MGLSGDSPELAWALWRGLGHLLGCLGPSWNSLGALLGSSWAPLAASWAFQGSSWAPLGLSWALLGPLGPLLGLSWASLWPLVGVQKKSPENEPYLGGSWPIFDGILGSILITFLAHF